MRAKPEAAAPPAIDPQTVRQCVISELSIIKVSHHCPIVESGAGPCTICEAVERARNVIENKPLIGSKKK